MNIPDEVIERAAEAYFLASDKDIGFDATTWEVDADEATKEQFRWAVKQVGPVIAEWARKEALREAAEAVAKVDEVDEYRDSDGEDYFWTINPEPFVDAVRALMAEGVSDGQQ